MAEQPVTCPLCRSDNKKIISTSLYKCKNCKTVYNTDHRQLSYGSCYFFEDYLKQYGKTYIDDFENIYNTSEKRLVFIKSILNRDETKTSLLDIGCAMGFFLKCAQDHGIHEICGIEISGHAAQYGKDSFSIDVYNTSFEEVQLDRSFSVITAWYFLEHLCDPVSALKKIYSLLQPGGVFAFSIPSVFGPLFLLHRQQWITSHPQDHRIDLTPGSARKILKHIGYRKIYTRPAAIHPERIIRPAAFFYKPFVILYKLFSKVTSFSDTLEVYAIK